ncbi:RNA 2',3'-cyclic phosphodiesterase [Crenothrix sp.]|uniref:RNA 2',3'-cyclic phosphodiesterase n=1 Tax=Crenothrix sp. TaxID=3100433 RepID=UPI00374DAA26
MKRLFFGLAPDIATRQQCACLQKAIDNGQSQAVAIANLHVTLVFLGAININTENLLMEEAATILLPEVNLNFDQLSYWSKPGILCLTSRTIGSSVLLLVEQLTVIAQKHTISIDPRPYQPHVTLARKAKQSVSLVFEPIIWHADCFHLFESCSTDHGVEYRILNSWSLKKQ